MKRTLNSESPAVQSYEQFCQRNGCKPTNMKADFFLSGYYAGQRKASEKMFELLPDEVQIIIDQVDAKTNQVLVDKLAQIRDGFCASYNNYPYPIMGVVVYKFDDDHFSVLVRYMTQEGYRLEHLRQCTLVPF